MHNEMKNLMIDFALRKPIYDAETDRNISNVEANDKIREFCLNKLGLNEKSTARQINRALKSPAAQELFEIIEDALDMKIATGWHENEFFNDYVETRNIADGDEQDFWTDKEVILKVAKVAGDHHDLIMQKLGEGQPYTVPMSVYAVKVGTDIRLFLTGRKNWADFVDAVAKAFTKQIMDELYAEVMSAGAEIPASEQFNKNGTLSAETKDKFDQLIEDVETANEGPAVIMGTKTALKKLNALSDINWRAESQKEAVAHTGILGDYEGTVMVEIPQRFANNDTATKLVDNGKLLIMPRIEDRFVKFVDGGETELEITERGETMNDQQSLEVQRRMGISTVITQYFGTWTF